MMKPRRSRTTLLPLILLACTWSFAGCGETKPTDNGDANGGGATSAGGGAAAMDPEASKAVVGNWKVVDMTMAKQAMITKAIASNPDKPRSEIESMFADDKLSYVFAADGKSESHDDLGNRGHEHVGGTWALNGKTFTLTESGKSVTGTLVDGKLTIAVLRFDGTPLPLVLEQTTESAHGPGEDH